MTHDEIQADLSSFALGALDADERRAVEEHLSSSCAACRGELATWQEVVGSMALAGPEAPAPDLKPALLKRLHAGPRPPVPRGKVITLPRWSVAPLAAAAAALLVFGLLRDAGLRAQLEAQQQQLVGARDEAGTARQAVVRLTQQLATQENDTAALRAALAAAQESLAIVQQPGLQLVHLKETPEARPAEAHALLSGDTHRALFYAFDLPTVPSDKAYELWWITEKEGPVRAGVFVPDQHGLGRLEAPLPTTGPILAVAVTIEAAAGVAKPTGPMVLKSVTS